LRILGIDPGLGRTGYALVVAEGAASRPVRPVSLKPSRG